MADKEVTIYDNGSASQDPVEVSIKGKDTVAWKGRSKSWKVVFKGHCPFTKKSFKAPAQKLGEKAGQHSGLTPDTSYKYWLIPVGGGQAIDPGIDIKP